MFVSSERNIIALQSILDRLNIKLTPSLSDRIIPAKDQKEMISLLGSSQKISGLILGSYEEGEHVINAVRKGWNDPWVPIALISPEETYTPFGCMHFTESSLDGLNDYFQTRYKPSLLVIEDDERLQDTLKQSLERNYDVDIYGDGLEAYKQLEKGSYDLVISDYMLPNLGGDEIAKLMRANNINIPLIIITAFNKDNLALNVLSYGANDYLPKPFSLDRVRQSIVSLLTQQQQKVHENYSKEEDELAWEVWKKKFEVPKE